MAIIYTYPVKASPAADDLILISDSADSNKTKQIKISSLPSSGAGITLTTNDTSGVATLTGSVLNIPNYTTTGGTPDTPLNSVQFNNASAFGGSANLTFVTDTLTVEHTAVIKGQGTGNPAGKLKLNCEENSHALTLEGPAHSGGADYTLKFPSSAPGNTQILQSNNAGQLSWITTPSGGGGGVSQVTAGSIIPSSAGAPLIVTPSTGNVVVTSARYVGGSNEGHVPLGGTNTTFLRGDGTWVTPSSSGGISFSGTTVNGIATYSNSTTANVSSVFTVSGNKLSAPAGSLADPSIEVGAIGGLYAASGGILLAHNGANAIGVTSSSIVNYKLTQFEAGLKFGSAGSTLSRYEEGTWTPTAYVPSGTAPTVTSSNGTYTIIGDICHITFKIVVTGSSSSNAAMMVGGIPAAAYGDSNNGEKSGGNLFVNSDSNTPAHYPSTFMIGYNTLTMIVQGGSKNSATSPFGLKAQDVVASWYRPSGGTGITLEGSSTYKLL